MFHCMTDIEVGHWRNIIFHSDKHRGRSLEKYYISLYDRHRGRSLEKYYISLYDRFSSDLPLCLSYSEI
jgi:hypothetical protein